MSEFPADQQVKLAYLRSVGASTYVSPGAIHGQTIYPCLTERVVNGVRLSDWLWQLLDFARPVPPDVHCTFDCVDHMCASCARPLGCEKFMACHCDKIYCHDA